MASTCLALVPSGYFGEFPTPESAKIDPYGNILEDLEDYYALLNLKHLKYKASNSQLKAAYRRIVLCYHPDKLKALDEESQDSANSNFIAIKKAYETLTDPQLRKIYESKIPFDDSIPDNEELIEQNLDFFEVYGPVFQRNSVFSTKKPAHSLGDKNSDINYVLRFYKFWRTFKSWREFSHHAEHKIEEAENRQERRWMVKENRSVVKKYLREESGRLRKLTFQAYEVDPRIIAMNREKREAKEKMRLEKSRKIEEAKNALKQKESTQANKIKIKQQPKQKRAKEPESLNEKEDGEVDLEATFKGLNIDLPFSKELLNSKNYGKTKELAKASNAKDENEQKTAFYRMFCDLDAEKRKAGAKESSQGWSDAEITYLTNSFEKFPSGVKNRWKKIRKCLMKEGIDKTDAAIQKKANQLLGKKPKGKGAKSEAKQNSANSWDAVQTRLLEIGLELTRDHKDPKAKWVSISEIVPGKTAKECLVEFRRIREELMRNK